MISDPVLAKKMSDLMLRHGAEIDSLAIELQASLPQDEFAKCRRAMGKILGAMLLEVMNPIYETHPEIKPPQLR